MKHYFVDTSYILALELFHDQNHHQAQQYWQQINLNSFRLTTTSYIFDEVVTYLNSRGYHQKAIEVGYMLLRSPTVTFIHVDKTLFRQSWLYFQQRQDKRYSLTDCISFVVMRQQKISAALTFDHHFRQAGFQLPEFLF